jgi:hypothetical protein
MADAYRALHPRGTAVVTQFSARPQLLVRLEKNHRPSAYTYAEAVFSPLIPRPTPESIKYIYLEKVFVCFYIVRHICILPILELMPYLMHAILTGKPIVWPDPSTISMVA